MISVYTMTLMGVTEADLRQWASHNLTNEYHIYMTRESHERFMQKPQEERAKGIQEVPVIRVRGGSDRLRVRESFDVTDTQFSLIEKYVSN